MTGPLCKPVSNLIKNFAYLLILLMGSCDLAFGQVTTGTPPLGSFTGGPDVINLANLNANFTVPILQKPGRGGMDFYYDLAYDTSIWYPVTVNGVQSWQPVFNWGWTAQTAVQTGYISYSRVSANCDAPKPPFPQYVTFFNFVYHDMWGVPHSFPGSMAYGPPACSLTNTTTMSSRATDNSGLTFTGAISTAPSITTHTITTTKGQVTTPPLNLASGYSGSSASSTDRNGNQISVTSTSSSATFTDTLNTAAVTVAGTATPASPLTFKYGAPSAQAAYTMKFTAQTVQTKFGCSITDYGPTANNLVSEIDLPDASKYTFTYETTPGDTHNPPYVTGRLKFVTFPTGGTISYSYSGGSSGHINCSDGSAPTLARTTPDGTWNYAQVKGTGKASTSTITDPQSNVTTIQFQGIYETQRQVNQGASTLLLTTNTCYNGAASPCNSTAITLPITQRATVSILPNNQQSKHIDLYSAYGVPTESDDYDYGTGSPGSLIKKVLITYASLGGINAFPQQLTICNGSGTASACNGTGTVVSQTSYNYDEFAVGTNIGTTPQHVVVSGSRGNLTSITYPVGTNSPSHNTYYDTGVLKTSTDVNGAVTIYNFPDAISTCGNAFQTSVTEPLSMSRSFAWNCTGGVMTTLTEENSQPTTMTYSDSQFWRPDHQTYPDGGLTTWFYNSPTSTTTKKKMNSSQTIASTVALDGLGRIQQQQLTDPQGPSTVYVDTTYDSLGRVASASNPYRSTSDPTYGVTAEHYDALNRPTLIIPPDGSASSDNVSISYTNNCVTTKDQAGKSTESCADGLGRTTQVIEDPTPGLNLETDYTYDALGNLLTVNQKGGSTNSANWRTRTYTYDGLSRLTSEKNPESGSVSYTYNSNGDLATKVAPAPNQTGTSTVTTTYTFDLLHRLTRKAYSDGTATASFSYDSGFVPTGATPANTKGRLVTAQDPLAVSAFSYDSMGRPVWAVESTPQNCCSTGWTLNYSYDLAGNMTSASNGFGTTFSYTYDSAGRPKTMTSSLVDSQHPAAIFTADAINGYFPHGALRKGALGNGLTETNMFNNRLQPCLIEMNSSNATLQTCNDSPPTGDIMDLLIGYNSTTSNNGNVTRVYATGAQYSLRSYGYDSLNRLSSMSDTVTTQPCQGLSWSYDNWGNRTNQTMTAGTCGQFQATADAQNRVHDLKNFYQYDAAGNMTHDASHSYTYDAENRLTAVDGGNAANYYYDAFGYRVHHLIGSSTLEYVRDLQGNVVSEILPSGGLNASYMYFGGKLVAEYYNLTTYFIHQDYLGSTRLVTAYPSASIAECDDYYPFGEANANVGTCVSGTTTHYKFTADERDSETSLDHTLFRHNSSSLGRWMIPDPAGLGAVDPTNPQSWNRYAYVLNNPLSMVDPLGLFLCDGTFVNPITCSDYLGQGVLSACTQLSLGSGSIDFSAVDGGTNPGSGQLPGQGSSSSIGNCFNLPPSNSGDFGGHSGGASGSGGGGNSSSPTWAAIKAFFTLPSTDPGSCLAVALDTVRGPLDSVKKVAENTQKYTGPAANALSSGSAYVAVNLNNMLRTRQLDPFLGPAVAAGATTVAAGLNSVAAGVAIAAPYIGAGLAIGAEGIMAIGVGKELYAAATGKCHP